MTSPTITLPAPGYRLALAALAALAHRGGDVELLAKAALEGLGVGRGRVAENAEGAKSALTCVSMVPIFPGEEDAT